MSEQSLTEQILDLLQTASNGMDRKQIARALHVKSERRAQMKTVLVELIAAGKIEKTERRKFRIIGRLPPVLVVKFHDTDADGELLARPRDPEFVGQTIRLAPGQASSGPNRVGVGDTALVKLQADEDGYQARVIRKLDMVDQGPILGVIRKGAGRWRIESISRKSRTSYVLQNQDSNKVRQGDLIRFEPIAARRDDVRQAKLVEHIGSTDNPKAASLLALVEQGIVEGFSAEEETQAANASAPTLGHRADLRELPLVTIDPDDARDFDDAVHAHADSQPDNVGGWVVWVAIADVAAFVAPDSALDRGARKRGNSVYLPDRVVPMLPERLSADLCSLRPNEDRACLAVRMVFRADGSKKSHDFYRGLMRSHARLTYQQAQNAINGQTDATTAPIVDNLLKPLWSAYAVLQAGRGLRQPLEIETEAKKIRIGDNGQVTEISTEQRLDAHKLIEECMVQANVCAAETLEAKHQPLIYRVHETPEQAKIYALADFLQTIGMKWAKAQRPTPERFNQLLRKVRGTDMEQMINQVVLRSQMRAIYDSRNIGHFGLSLPRYAHFTSPIRRYADLTIHRALISACKLGSDGSTEAERADLKTIAEQITKTERAAMAAERDAASRYIAAHLAEQIGAVFSARISGVTRFGLFLTLDETGADGLVPIRALGREYFNHDEQSHALIGRDTGGRYRLGSAVKVRLSEATPVTGGLIFEMLSKAEAGTRPKRHASKPGRGASHRGKGRKGKGQAKNHRGKRR
ncbi:3'-to-5' exoribonuclease RNase R [hydrothermal vent metagenome]|uniref:exoribonuclease II n=1 Tax=hydrothermal vent metagenome TaxID=652676 RepID=A0A3B0S018_9ZZZZ